MPEGILTTTTWNGSNAVLLTNEEIFDPSTGWNYRQEWVGTKGAIEIKRAEAITAGWRTSRSVQGDQYFLTITSPDPALQGEGGTETPVDVYDLTTEYESSEIWTNPKLLDLAFKSTLADRINVISYYKHFCRTRLRDLYNGWVSIADELAGNTDGKATRGVGPTPYDKLGLYGGAWGYNPVASAELDFGDGQGNARIDGLALIYWNMLMGLENWEVRRVVLSRRRTVSARYAAQHVVDGVEKVYTTAGLKHYFAIPTAAGEIGTRLPSNPSTTPPGTAWAWKIRRQDSQQMRGTARVEEVIDWVFAAWSLTIYDLIDAP